VYHLLDASDVNIVPTFFEVVNPTKVDQVDHFVGVTKMVAAHPAAPLLHFGWADQNVILAVFFSC
jgi:hypothetical protein